MWLQEQDKVSSRLSDQEEKIANVQQARHNYAKTSRDVVAWLENAETVLGQITPTSIEAGQQQQQVGGRGLIGGWAGLSWLKGGA